MARVLIGHQWSRAPHPWWGGRVLPLTLPRLGGTTVVLRDFEDRDAPLVVEAARDPHIPLITTVPTHPDDAAVAAYLERQRGRPAEGVGYSFAVADAATDRAVGQIGLWTHDLAAGRVTVGHWVAAPFRGRGYATAALDLLTAWALTHDEISRVQLVVEPWNVGSWRAAERCGFRREGLLRSWERVGTERRDMYGYAVVRGDRRAKTG